MNHTTKLYIGVGTFLGISAAIAASLMLSTKHLDAQIDLQHDAMYETDLGFVNVRKYAIGDVLIESATGKHQRIGNIATEISALTQTEAVAITRLKLKSGLNLSFSLEVPEDVKTKLQSEVLESIELSLVNSRRKTLNRDAISTYLASEKFLSFLDTIHWNVQGAQQRIFVVSTTYPADELRLELKDFKRGENNTDTGKLQAGKYEINVNVSNAADLWMKGSDFAAIFEFSPYIWTPSTRTVKLNQNYPYW
jgi:hypothetical protein